MEELFEQFERKYPGFKDQIKGASGEEISELEDLAGRSLPPDYISFLLLAGHGTGDLFEGYGLAWLNPNTSEKYPLHYDFTIETVKKHYRKIRGRVNRKTSLSNQNRFNPDFFCIGTQSHSEDGGYYYFDFRQPGKHPVINIDTHDEIQVLASSFREFILKMGFQGRFSYLI